MKYGIRYDPAILNWSIVFLARSSRRLYCEVAKAFGLPSIDYVYKLSRKIVGSNSARAYSICVRTMATLQSRSVAEKWIPNQFIGLNSIDSASVATGIQWDNTRNMMVGQCQSHHFQPMTKKFHQMADERKADAAAEDPEKEQDDPVSCSLVSALFDVYF